MEQTKFIQEMKPQDKASSSYVHRKLQELSFVKKLNTNKYRQLKEYTLAAINSNKALETTSKPNSIDKKDIDAVQTFIKTVQASIQYKTFMPLKYTDPRGSRYFSLLPLYKIDSKSYKTLESLHSRPNSLRTNVITTDGYAVPFIFKKTVVIHDESTKAPKTPKDFVDIVDDAKIWAVDPGISTIFTAVDSTEHERIRTTS
ncbi:hypothetical protein G6F67_001961 [Rhizopus microsporus]|nr:hypothetical protein G6F67_001961 [Rhizopus microsporus]